MDLAFSSVMGTGFPSVFITDRGWKEEYLLRVAVVVAVGGSKVMFRKFARGSAVALILEIVADRFCVNVFLHSHSFVTLAVLFMTDFWRKASSWNFSWLREVFGFDLQEAWGSSRRVGLIL